MPIIQNTKEELIEKITQLVGEASMCWDLLPTGVFNSEKAIEVAKKIVNEVSLAYEQGKKEAVEEIREMVKDEMEKNKTADCLCKRPRSITAENYDCSDIHLGRTEALSDLLVQLNSKE